MANKCDKEITFDEKMWSKKSHNLLIVYTSGHMTNKKRYISISTRPVAIKLDRMVAQT